MEIPRVEPERCDGCGECLLACCADAIALEDGKACIGDDCIACLACVFVCPQGAIVEPVEGGRPRRRPVPMRPASARIGPGQALLWPPRRR